MNKIIFLALLLLAGCSTNSGIIADGKETYIVIVSGGNRFSSSSDLKIEAYKNANAYCRQFEKQIETVSEKSVQAGVLASVAEAELKFKCISN